MISYAACLSLSPLLHFEWSSLISFSVTALGIISYLFIAEKYCIVYRYPIICIHSSEISTISLLPRLGCCIFGLWLQECPLHFFIFSGFRFLGPKSTSMLFFKWPSILFSLLKWPMYIVINSSGGFPCLYTLSSIYSFLNNFTYSFVFGCTGPRLQKSSSLYLQWAGLLSSFTVEWGSSLWRLLAAERRLWSTRLQESLREASAVVVQGSRAQAQQLRRTGA